VAGDEPTADRDKRGKTDGTRATFSGGLQFPSIIQIPSSGCWRLSLNTGVTQHLTVLAVN
jgi:hypothetical protein